MSWKPARVPSYAKNCNITYIIEIREPPALQWNSAASGISETTHTLSDLNTEQDYMFRVRAANEFGSSDPSLPATLHREIGKVFYTFYLYLFGILTKKDESSP